MRALLSSFIFLLLPLFTMAQLQQHRWQDRVILIFADSDQNQDFTEQWQDLQADKAGLKDRDLVVYRIFNQTIKDPKLNEAKAKQLSQRYHSDAYSFKVILIGKDGGVKAQQNKPIPKDELFALIDGMPMRRAEIRRKSGGN